MPSSSSDVKVDFFGVGPQRTASSWLHEVLSYHPNLAFPEDVKETMFFDQRYDKGIDWYLWHFRHAAETSLKGEIAPTYFDSPLAAERIAEHNSNAKILINIRNPIEQAYSLFRHHYSKGRVKRDFFAAARAIPNILTAAHYKSHCEMWEIAFPGRVSYLIQEDIMFEPGKVLDFVLSFLGVHCIELPDIARSRVNSADAPRSRLLARILSGTATQLRALRLHRLIATGKKIGLKAVYRGGNSINRIGDECFDFLASHFANDIEWIEQKFDRKFPEWRINRTTNNSDNC